MFKRSLTFKIIFFFLIVFSYPFLIVSITSYLQAKNCISTTIKKNLSQLIFEVGIEVEDTVFSSSINITSLAANPIIKSEYTGVEEKLLEMQKVQDLYKTFEAITLINTDGVVESSTSYGYRGEWQKKIWFQKAKDGKSAVSPPHIITNPFKIVIVVTAPVFTENGEVKAVLAGQVNMEEIWEITDRVKIGKTGFIFLTDKNGNILAFPERDKLLYKISPDNLRDALLSNQEGIVQYEQTNDKKRICCYLALKGYKEYAGQGWRIGLSQEFSEAYSLINKMRKSIMLISICGIFFIFLLSGLLSQKILQPIKLLIAATGEVAQGDLNSRVRVNSRDEIGDLGIAFNQMGESLKKITSSRDELSKEILQREKAELKMIKAKEEAELANQTKSRFLANISHEIRTPLNIIIGFSEIISHSGDQKEMIRQAKTILKESEILLQLINDLLDNAKMEAGKITLEIMPFDLEQLTISVSSHANLIANKKQLEWRVLINNDVPRRLLGDQLRLRQIILNLVNNAFKFTKKGSVELSIDVLENDSHHIRLRFSIKDTGIGIPKEKQKFIFESFTQADNSITRRFGGTGLGTNIAKNLVDLMGGEIGLDSDYGKGSTFWFTASFSALSAEENKRFQMATAAYYDERTVQYRGRTTGLILVADDYEPNQEVALKHLESVGHIVEIVSNGKAVLAACEKKAYDLILMDMQMPEMDGCTAANLIRNGTSSNADKPILGLTADTSMSARKICLDSGMNDVVIKPLRRASFLNIVNNWLRQSEGKQEVEVKTVEKVVEGPVSSKEKGAVPFNYEQALQLFDGDREFLDSMIDKFLKTARAQITLIKEALKNNAEETIRREAHKLKSGAGNITAMSLSSAAAMLEELIKSERLDDCNKQVDKVEKEFSLLEKYVAKR